ncbi:uncharacterized protein SPPG_02539 [Spizellomyces punctatus DAOM BR117]|uniref:G-protein coupled receptors family 2 profile 2 domain-containing protein n=1 Tax=Spizellomyces punctatus (strain DAOM BR117) TaxID=645134 RepID=A0A0L0HKP0_SPIPD|nr:uncharacterized protein SPPG_02539 [Spizellomyces punctatus DAOM BR117]KND02036.1 hypothetical protein SPPG_02539 [Spizellomyces punctatus DAOM BR117]|eukprot:XP_016610075.1 hypothetical protein SPPG_02539 [Spizellomyces punctatus DAOM BR117]
MSTRTRFDGEVELVWNITHISSLVSIFLSLIGEVYLFIHIRRYFIARRRNGRYTSPSRRPPAVVAFAAAIAISDFLFSVHHGIDHLHSLITGYVADGALCEWLGFGSLLGLDSTAVWSFMLALYMSCLVLFGIRLDDNERKAWTFMALIGWGVPLVAGIIVLCLGFVDNAGMFCMVNQKVASVVLKPGLFLSVFFFIALSYIAIAVKLSMHDRVQSSLSADVDQHIGSDPCRVARQQSKLQTKIGLHLLRFTVVYVLQFLPVCVIVFTTALGGTPSLTLNVFDKILANGNGWMNAIAYRHFAMRTQDDNSASSEVPTRDAAGKLSTRNNPTIGATRLSEDLLEPVPPPRVTSYPHDKRLPTPPSSPEAVQTPRSVLSLPVNVEHADTKPLS